jgi:hypothetical protein
LNIFLQQFYLSGIVAEKLSSTNKQAGCNTHRRGMPRAIHKVIHRFCGYHKAQIVLRNTCVVAMNDCAIALAD